ncbi:putative ABC transporter substrate-binding lipoprotein YvgL [Propionispora sp. 2/2-37]|uniref:molybdate ABC transporter substrate-binding protein n=1 Tax=Propionispora sp. 2/2-37 TaxID=1677858 RepID=UPI0006BB7229|nr:molybdate ABC transporter substrate-binding protein [Propionispora sp. 2/2-37]CUH94943.1 putative ABC transporter substrate-binding lipoprotein YvgL [Propionispora sp. 2/2-37]
MKRLTWIITLSVVFASALLAGCGGTKTDKPVAPPAEAAVELNVSAAVSLKDALAEIQKNFEAKHSNVKVIYNLGSSGSLQKQIEQGAPADIFISAAPRQMNELADKNLVNKDSRKNLVENKLVVVIPKDSTLFITKYEDLAGDAVHNISVGETATVPAGQYAQEVLKKLDIWDKLQNKIVFGKDVRTVLTYVETGNVDAGIVYKTDAAVSDKVKIAAAAPEGSHKPIVYPAAILSGTKQQKTAEEFLAYLRTPESKAIFEKYGFTMSK